LKGRLLYRDRYKPCRIPIPWHRGKNNAGTILILGCVFGDLHHVVDCIRQNAGVLPDYLCHAAKLEVIRVPGIVFKGIQALESLDKRVPDLAVFLV